MRDCIDEGTLRAYADGALTLSQEAIVAMHLAQCPFCKGNLAALDVLTSEVRLLVNDSLPLPDSQLALGRLRSSIPKRPIAVTSPAVVAYTGEALRPRPFSRGLRLQPVAMGVGLGAAVVAVLVLLFAVSGLRPTATQPSGEFVPEGMVRELTFSHIIRQDSQPANHYTTTVWLTKGQNHILMYSTFGTSVDPESSKTWIEEDAVYSYGMYPYGDKIVRKLPYDARYLSFYVPNEISELLKEPNARILGDDTFDGRPVTVIEAIADNENIESNPNAPYTYLTDVKLWVDKETSLILQRQTTSFPSGDRQGSATVNTMKVENNVLKDASQFAPDFFKFKPIEGVTLVDAPSPFGDLPTATPEVASKSSDFVPGGMVRHFTVSHIFTTTVEGQPSGTTVEEVWLTNGKDHLLRYSTTHSKSLDSGSETWVEDDAVYIYNYFPANKTTVHKYPYDPRHLELYVPNEINNLLTIPNAKIVGDDVLDGRPVTVIEAIADKVNPTPETFTYPEGVAQGITDYKFWVDKETSQVLQREHRTTFPNGKWKGKTQTQIFKVTANELKDASQFAPDFFEFKLPYNATVIEEEWATPTPATTQASEFLPLGKVRYMKVAWTWQAPGIDNGRIDEIWLGNGKEHLLLRTNTLHVDVSKHVREHGVMFTRVTDEAVYVYYKYGEDAYKHYKYPYNQRFISWYVPQDIDSLLAIPRAQITGDDILDGRPVTVIESITGKPSNIAAPDPTQREVATTDLRFWVDKESSLLLKRESVTTFVSGARSGTTETETFRITLNELRDRSTLTEDFFEYTPDGTIIDGVLSPFDATPTPGR